MELSDSFMSPFLLLHIHMMSASISVGGLVLIPFAFSQGKLCSFACAAVIITLFHI